MKKIPFYIRSFASLLMLVMVLLFSACEKGLENKSYNQLSTDNFFKSAADAQSAVTAMYVGLMGGKEWQAGWGSNTNSWKVQDSHTTGELICYWGGDWANFHALNFTPDIGSLTIHYTTLMPYISQITVDIDKISAIDMDAALKARFIAELKCLRGLYSYILYDYYGPVPVRLDAKVAADPGAPPIPRPSKQEMVGYIERDFKDASAALPARFTGADYGRVSAAVCQMGLLKLYMHEKRWQDAVTAGQAIKGMGYALTDNYATNFSYAAKGGTSEIILAIPCSPTAPLTFNCWLAHVLPTDYIDPGGVPLTEWGGYRMPWTTYDKFDQSDKRLGVLLQKYPTASGMVDARVRGDIGAVPLKYGPDPTKASSQNMGTDFVVYRYADVELLLAEALNEVNGGPTKDAFDLINDVRVKHGGLSAYTQGSLDKTQFLKKLQDERLFELWAEGVRRDDLIRWGLYLQRAIDDGFATNAQDYKLFYPIPRSVVNQSNGVIAQTPGYK